MSIVICSFPYRGERMKNVVILGSTGSIGTQALDIIDQSNRYNVFGLACLQNIALMEAQIRKFKPKYAVVYDTHQYQALKVAVSDMDVCVLSGMDGLNEIVSKAQVDIVLTSIVGNIGLEPTVTAIKAQKTIALANKETLVTAGELIMQLAKEHHVKVLPVDSEHSAIFQCINGEDAKSIDKILLTASGGAFRDLTKDEIRHKKAKDALKHPNWSMGNKITIDSATLMNKGLEFIEAKWLFDMPSDRIDVLIHPQSIIHSMVQFNDHSVIAQLGTPDMRVPIIYALDYPHRFPNKVSALDFTKLKALTFDTPDVERFPCLSIAMEALSMGGIMPTVMNAANEILVTEYLKDAISFYDISDGIMKAMSRFSNVLNPDLKTILACDAEVRSYMMSIMKG